MKPSARPPVTASSSAQPNARAVSAACGQKLALDSICQARAAAPAGEVSANGAAQCSACQMARPASSSSTVSRARRHVSAPSAAAGAAHSVEQRVDDVAHDDEQHQRIHRAVVEIVVGVGDGIAEPGRGQDELAGDDADEAVADGELDAGEQMGRRRRQLDQQRGGRAGPCGARAAVLAAARAGRGRGRSGSR